jgi:hypothetical protein
MKSEEQVHPLRRSGTGAGVRSPLTARRLLREPLPPLSRAARAHPGHSAG